jgi:stalled ribosome alternative rescue factor ArfA
MTSQSAVKKEVCEPKYRMRVVGSGKGKGSYKRPKSNQKQWEVSE